MAAGWRLGITRGRRPRRTILGGAIKAQQSCATFKDRHTRVESRVRGAMGKEKKRLKIQSSTISRKNPRRPAGSKLATGSSKMRSFGSCANARMIDKLCFCPPENLPMILSYGKSYLH